MLCNAPPSLDRCPPWTGEPIVWVPRERGVWGSLRAMRVAEWPGQAGLQKVLLVDPGLVYGLQGPAFQQVPGLKPRMGGSASPLLPPPWLSIQEPMQELLPGLGTGPLHPLQPQHPPCPRCPDPEPGLGGLGEGIEDRPQQAITVSCTQVTEQRGCEVRSGVLCGCAKSEGPGGRSRRHLGLSLEVRQRPRSVHVHLELLENTSI